MDVVTEITEVDGEDTTGSFIDKLAKMDDAQLMEITGMNSDLEKMKKDIVEMSGLKGKAREEAERIVSDMFEPDVDAHRIRWALEDSKRAAKRTGKEELACDSPSSVMD